MKRNVIIMSVAAVVLIMFLLDYQMSRIGLLELEIKKLHIDKRLSNLEVTSGSREDFGWRLEQLESRVIIAHSAYAYANLLHSQMNFTNPLIDERTSFDAILNNNGIFIFRTEQSPEMIDDARIGGMDSQKHFNWGKLKSIDIGRGNEENIYRSLIKFKQIKSGVLKGAKIIGAIMYLWVYDDAKDNDMAMNEVAEIYALRKEWGEGEVSWLMASEEQTPWTEPGANNSQSDISPTILASSGPHINGHTDSRIPFYFSEAGIARLQEWIDGTSEPQHGFLISFNKEPRPGTHITFFSSEYYKVSKRPYLKIYYTKMPNTGDLAQ